MAGAGGRAAGARRRPQLDRELILEAATQLAARGEPITFRALGAALEADPTAVYRHFRDKEELVRAVLDRLLVGVVDQVDRSATWRDQLRSLAELTLQVCLHYPSVGEQARSLTTGGVGEMTAVELILEQFQHAGLGPSDAVRFYAVYSSFILSVAGSLAAARLSLGPAETMDDAAWIGEIGPVDPRRFPAISEARHELARLQDTDIFLTGVDVILDAAAAAARRRSRQVTD
jgi:AcrR family transcriptional regulator